MNIQNLVKAKDYLKGKKTHIIALLMVAVSLVNLLTGEITVMEFINSDNVNLLLNGAGLSGMRAGLEKVQKVIGK